MDTPEIVMALTTVAQHEAAQRLARRLLEGRWLACVTVLPGAQSLYWWQGAIEQADEWVLLMKTTAARWPALQAALQSLHPYETPEVLMWPVAGVTPAYADWVAAAVAESGGAPHLKA